MVGTQDDPAIVTFELDHHPLSFSRFLETAGSFLGLIHEVATDIVGRGGVRWIIEDVSRSSPLRLEVRPVATRKDIRRAQLITVSASVADGLAMVQRRPERPPHFSDRALEKAQELARGVGRDISLLRVSGVSDRADVTGELVANVDAILGETVTSLGTIDGWLEALNVHQTRYFTVYDVLTSQRVRCDFGHRIRTEDVAHAVERRVAVYGEIGYRANGEIVGMTAHRLEVFPPAHDLPTADDVRGILRA